MEETDEEDDPDMPELVEGNSSEDEAENGQVEETDEEDTSDDEDEDSKVGNEEEAENINEEHAPDIEDVDPAVETFVLRDEVMEESVYEGSLIHVLVDSGAFNHVCPVEFAEEFPTTPTQNPVGIRTASGQLVKHVGSRLVPVKLTTGEFFWINFQVCEQIRRPILSVSALNDQGIVVCFGQKFSYIKFGTQRRPLVRQLVRQRRLFYLPVMIKDVGSTNEEKPDQKQQETHHFTGEAGALDDGVDDNEDPEPEVPQKSSSSWERPPQQEQGRVWMPEDTQVQVPPPPVPTMPRGPKQIVGPSRKDWLNHQKTHLPYQAWCKYCVMGRGKERPHHRVPETHVGPVPLVQLDFLPSS